jgi:hypothetical protein
MQALVIALLALGPIGPLGPPADLDFWAFRPLREAAPPEVAGGTGIPASWARTSIDRFILHALEARGLRPNPIAGRRTLIRRAYLDVLGLPPAPEDIERFVADSDPEAWPRLVDRLLASPRYGERWARHWLDVARFAESHGYEQDYDRPHAYHYRDFVIKALNSDMPYDQFVRWQLAGDEAAPGDPLALAATGFLGGGAFPTQLTEAEFESARYDELDDMVSTTGAAFLGLTVGCARCHNHKYDPISSLEYYSLVSAFTRSIRSEIEVETEGGERATVQVTSEGLKPTKHHADERGFPHFYDTTHVLERGDVHKKRGEAPRAYLAVLMRDGKDPAYWDVLPAEGSTRTSLRRSALARWITDAERGAGHLAARVIVNRLWHHHFGRGLVATPNDFGAQGERPSHPELIDWLASDLLRNGWSLKRLHRLILTSAVYMQSGDFDEARAALDRENVLLWRRAPRRLEAEAVRDSMLEVAGLLDTRMYGPGTLEPDMRRRSVYFFIKRSQLIPAMMLFDWPEHLVSIGRRVTTTIAPQALMFLNSPLGRDAAEGLAKRLAGLPPEEAIERAFALAFGRPPAEAERRAALVALSPPEPLLNGGGGGIGSVDGRARLALADFCLSLLSANEFLYVD